MSEQISIVRWRRGWRVEPGRVTRSKLWFYAPRLEVYVWAGGELIQFDVIANIAMNEAQSRHIPANSLKTVPLSENRYGGEKPAAGKPVQKTLPLYDDDTTGEK